MNALCSILLDVGYGVIVLILLLEAHKDNNESAK